MPQVLKYHNITPPEFFAGISIDYEHVCRSGGEADQRYRSRGLRSLPRRLGVQPRGVAAGRSRESRGFVVAPFHHVDKLTQSRLKRRFWTANVDDQINILMVGRVAPNKGHATLIDTLAVYRREYNQHARLLIVGKEVEQL